MPTLDLEPQVSADDGHSNEFPLFQTTNIGLFAGTDANGDDTAFFCRFPNVTIPPGATIDVAYLTFEFYLYGGSPLTNIFFNASDDATAPTDRASHVAKARTTAFTPYDGVFVAQSDSIVAPVQEVIDRPLWVSGNAMMALHDDDGSPTNVFVGFASFDHITLDPPILHIEYSLGSPIIAWIQDDMG
ncbi:MAG: hypothetical protein V3W28_00175 [Thermoplasmata archaeon]